MRCIIQSHEYTPSKYYLHYNYYRASYSEISVRLVHSRPDTCSALNISGISGKVRWLNGQEQLFELRPKPSLHREVVVGAAAAITTHGRCGNGGSFFSGLQHFHCAFIRKLFEASRCLCIHCEKAVRRDWRSDELHIVILSEVPQAPLVLEAGDAHGVEEYIAEIGVARFFGSRSEALLE